MKQLKNLLLYLSFSLTAIFIACSEDEPAAQNEAPKVANPIADQNLVEGFGTIMIDLGNAFSDTETDALKLTAMSSDPSVASVNIAGQVLTISEEGVGNTTIQVTAEDESGDTVSDDFIVSVSAASNSLPTVISPLEDVSLTEGFGSLEIKLVGVFNDLETMMLQFSVQSSATDVVTADVVMADLTITEVGLGTSIITVTAMDEDGGAVSDEFEVSVTENTMEECTNDNTTNQTPTDCDRSNNGNTYSEVINGGMRNITASGIPNHDFGNQFDDIPDQNVQVTAQNYDITFTATPSKAASITNILTSENRPSVEFGIAINGVKIDPAPAEPFIFTDSNGEFNWDWVFEPTNNTQDVGLDCAVAHVQPTGAYHYHGDMEPLAILNGFVEGQSPASPIHIGWAADGFPIVYKYGPTSNGSGTELLKPSYKLRNGERTGDGNSEPCGSYNGKYTNDYVYDAAVGDLDECNGIDRNITLVTQAGQTETFEYFYVITEDFPVIGRCLVGTPDSEFSKGQGGG